ncbi:MAG TPA: DUF3857 domain-containing protein, partial [Planctomycetota bacterium]|nr:DUF3857 domain-containing protein [Planctomycetota bacterium]
MKRTLLPRARAPRAAFALLAVATWAAAQTSVRAAFEEAVARGDRAGALRSGVEELRRRCAAPPSGEAEVDAAAFLMRVAPFAVDAPGEWLAALETCRGEGRFGALIAARRADALARIGRRDEAVAAWRALGVVGRWLVAGPFDNERGAGFKATAPPETSPVDPEAVFDGKDRKVGWRSVSADLPYGVWHLGDLVTPREQALVVLAAALQTEAPRAVALALGSSGPVAVRLNGREVFRSDAARELAYEQDLVRLDLAAGTNELLVKTGVEQGPFSVYVRLAAVDGGPPPADVRISSAPDAFRRTPFPPAPESAASRPAPDDFLARAAAAASAADASPAALERWIRLRLGLTLDDAAKPATADVAERLLKLRPDDLAARELRATSLRRRVRVAAERADNARLEALEATLALDPKHVPTLVEIARTAMDELNQPELARAKLAVAAAAAPRAAAVLRLQARLAQYDGQTGEAERLLKAAAEAGGPFDRLALGDFYAERGRFRDAEATFAAAHGVAAGERDVIDRRLRRAQMRGDLDGAMASARELVALVPTEARLRLRLAAAHEARGDFEGALREAEAQLAYDPENVDALKRAALNADRLDRREDALRFVARALVVAPGDLKLRRYEGRLAGAEKAFEDAFPLDVDAIVRAAPDVSVNPENRSHRVLLSRRITLVHPEGTTADFHQQVVQILSEAGVAAFDTVAAWHDPGDQRARFRTARLHRPGEAPQEAQRQGTWGADFPPLRPGDVVEWSYRVDDLRTGVFGNYVGVRHPFQDRSLAETVRSELTLLLPKSRGFRFHVRHADLTPEPVAVPGFLDGYEGRRYVVNDLPAITWEPAMPYPEEFVPEVQVSTYESWDAFAAWWWNLIRDQIDVNDAMRAKVRELTAGLTDDEAKLRRLYGFVVTD